jgi:hypothetical protein
MVLTELHVHLGFEKFAQIDGDSEEVGGVEVVNYDTSGSICHVAKVGISTELVTKNEELIYV